MDKGFSLLELSIVLVIIGLLAGGVMTGQALIRAAEMRAASTEYQRFVTAIHAFRDKYQATPGDFKNATAFWGKDNTNCSGNTGTAATPGTCNGNGSGVLDNSSIESFRFWQQMALAGLIEGTYSGQPGGGGTLDNIIGTNSPASKMTNAGWSAANASNYTTGDADNFGLDYGNFIEFGSQVSGGMTGGAVLKPEEAWNIDTKLDDGKPGYGKVIGRFWNNKCSQADNSTPTATNLASSYKLSDASLQCALYFVRAF